MPPLDLNLLTRLFVGGRAIAECAHAGRIIWIAKRDTADEVPPIDAF